MGAGNATRLRLTTQARIPVIRRNPFSKRGPHSYFVVAMSSFENDREMLRLISAFKEIESPGMRRAIVLLVEELAQKRELVRKAARKDS